MGVYVYKVTAKKVRDDQGRLCNELAYAYKPCYQWTAQEESRVRFGSGLPQAKRFVESRSRNWTGRIAMEDGGPSVVYGDYEITDDAFHARVAEAQRQADELVRSVSAFSSMDELLSAEGYRPSLCMNDEDCRKLADLYDRMQAARGDERRAYRYRSAA